MVWGHVNTVECNAGLHRFEYYTCVVYKLDTVMNAVV